MFGFEEKRKERTPATRYVTFRRKERVAERKPENTSIARAFVTPKAAAELLELSSGVVSPPRKPLPVLRTSIVRKPPKSVPVVFAEKGTGRTEGHREMEVRKRLRPMLPEKAELEGTPDFLDAAPTMCEDRKISMKPLHQFAKNRLPKESILREIILMEKEELTPEQFLDRVEIWLRLFDRES